MARAVFPDGLQLIISPLLPLVPSLEDDVVRMVRHGLADVLEWLGEDPGPAPGVEAHVVVVTDGAGPPALTVSREMFERLRGEARDG